MLTILQNLKYLDEPTKLCHNILSTTFSSSNATNRSSENDMNDHLNCNVHKCNATLNGRVWVTRCLHVFCSEHGTAFFHNYRTEVNCPVCNEVNIRENDTLLCHTNPSDMILAGLRPEKVIRLVERSFKLWKCQMEADRRHESSTIRILKKQMEENTEQFKQVLVKKDADCNSQLATMKGNYNDIMIKLQQVNQELETAQASLRRYKAAYESLASMPRPSHHRQSHLEPPVISPTFTRDSLMDDHDIWGSSAANRYFHQH